MKQLILFCILITFISCNGKPKKIITKHDLNGSWECVQHNGKPTSDFLNLYVNDSLFQYDRFQSNNSTYSISHQILVINDNGEKRGCFGLSDLSNGKLTVVLKSDWRISRLSLKKGDTLVFKKHKKNDKLKINRVTFKFAPGWTGDAFNVQIDSDRKALFNGMSKDNEFQMGKTTDAFWNILVDKIKLVELKQFNEIDDVHIDDASVYELIIETNKGTYSCITHRSNSDPASINDINEYFMLNTKTIEFETLKLDQLFNSEGSIKSKAIRTLLEQIPC